MIHLFRGDSANETFGNQITVALETDMDTTDCKASLSMPYAEDKTSFIVDGRAVFTFTTEETAQIPFGEYYASLSLLNGSAKLTIRDDLIVSVTDSVAEASRDNTISVDVVGRFTEALKGVVWDEGSTIKTLREFLSRVGEAMGATVVRLALVSMLPLFAFSQGTIDADLLRPNIQVVTNAFQNASNDIARLIESTITPSDRITDGRHTIYPSLDYDETDNVPETWNVDGEILYPSTEGVSWTNGTMSLLYENATQNWYMNVGEDGSAGMDYPRSATNMDFSIGGVVYQARLVPPHTETRTVGRVALTNDVPSNASVNGRLEKTNPVGFGGIDWGMDGLSIRGDVDVNADQVHISAGMISLESLSDGFTFNDSRVVTEATMPSILTTNDVCNIVTNEVIEGWNEWSFSDLPIGATNFQYSLEGSGFDADIVVNFVFQDISFSGSSPYDYDTAEPVEIQCDDEEATASYTITATRTRLTRNALGLARLIDLPPLTNDVPYMISSAAQAAISTNNPAFVAAVTNCPVVIAAVDETTLGEFGDYGTLGALLAALAAAITWLKTNKADSSSLPYALVDVTVESVPYVLSDCFPIVYTISGQATTITDADSDGLRISPGNNAYTLYHNGFSLLIMDDGGVYVELDNPSIESLTFNGVAPTANTTPVLGFTHTAQLTDRASSAVSLTESATLAFPAQTDGKARDFVVRLTLTETNNVVPSVTFPADVAYETEGGEWPDLTEAGTYIVRLTEVPKASESETVRFFLQCSSAVADATPPSAGGAA